MRRDFESHRIICFNVTLRCRRIATSKRKVSSLPLYKMCENDNFQSIGYFVSFQPIPAPILIMIMLWIHSGPSESSFHMQNSSIWTQLYRFRLNISYFLIGLWFKLIIINSCFLYQIKHCTFLLFRPQMQNYSPRRIFVSKTTDFVKLPKTSFLARLTSKCTRVLRTTGPL